MVKEGMRNVVALSTDISQVNGKEGKLEYRGYSIEDLAEKSNFEETTYLLFKGELPTKEELEEFSGDLVERRRIPPEVIGLLTSLPDITHPMVVLRTAISYCGSLDPKLHNINSEENLRKSKEILAMLPTIIAYTYRLREGKRLIHPRNDLGHAANFLYMLKGKEPTPEDAELLDMDLILHAEHTLNASTYSSRIAASTKSDMYAGVISATGTLMGPLHGGASQAVMEMLREIRKNDLKPEEWVEKQLEDDKIIPGFGHRVYETMDPRARILKETVQNLENERRNGWCEIAEQLEEAVRNKKGLDPNVDFYAATVYANLGIPDDFFIPIFAMSRIAGWTTHLMDQYEKNTLIRPIQEYSGEEDKKYIPIKER
ncbi:MAG: citrate/2-methylcitrate synthase [Candidatus Hadarchaeia archaeon]